MRPPHLIPRCASAAALGAVTILFMAPAPRAQKATPQEKITVRYINARTGAVLKGVGAYVWFYNGDTPALAANDAGSFYGKSDKNGEVSVAVPRPLPEHMIVGANEFWCNNTLALSPAQVLKAGAVVPYLGDRSRIDKKSGKIVPYSSFSPPPLHIKVRPGEIVVINVKMPWWHP